MHTPLRTIGRTSALLAAIAGAALWGASTTFAAGLPASTCTLSGSTRTCDLYATTGTLTLPNGSTVPIWGYSATAGGTAQLPGPTMIANQGETLVIKLHNSLTKPTGLNLPGIDVAPDLSGVAAGGTKTYTFSASAPGTYLYEAGGTADAPRQVAMGLFGGLIVRPSGHANWAYDGASQFNDEALLIYSEIDPAFNANPASFKMQHFAPKYLLINGKVSPQTAPISTTAGNKLLLRQINAGLEHHTVGTLGLRQTVIAQDAVAETFALPVVAESIAAGQSLDTLVTIPASAPAGAKYALYDTGMVPAGLTTFITTAAGSGGADTVGPAVTSASVNPASSSGNADLAVSATLSDANNGNGNVTAAEYFIDTTGSNGSGTAFSGSFGSPTVTVNATVSASAISGLSSGAHTVYIHGKDAAGNWGAIGTAVFTLDKTGPSISAIAFSPNPSNRSAAVSIQATASDTASGNAAIAQAEYSIDGGAASALTVNQAQPTASLNGTIPLATVQALGEGAHTISIRARDEAGNWGAAATSPLKIDVSGPQTSNGAITPNPSDGTVSASQTVSALKITATFSDPTSNGVQSLLKGAEAFVDTQGTSGTGIQFAANDGVFNSSSEGGYAWLTLSIVQTLSSGNHTIYIHGQDVAGNWGSFATATLVVDTTVPTASGASITPSLSNGTSNPTISANANGTGTAIAAAEYYIGTDPGKGNGTALTVPANIGTATVSGPITIGTMAYGNYTVYLRVKDAAGNWSATTSATFTLDRLFANSFASTTSPYGWSSVGGTGSRLSVSSAANMKDGNNGLAVSVNSSSTGTAAYVINTLAAGQSNYRARFYINPNNVTLNGSTPTIFTAMSSTTTAVSVQLQKSGTSYQVRAVVARSNTATNTTGWYTINGATPVEIAWTKGTNASFTLYTGGTLRQTLTGLNTSTYSVNSARLGLSAGAVSGMSGSIFFDGFVSTRTAPIGT